MTMMAHSGLEAKLSFRIPNHDVSIAADRERSFSPLHPDQSRRRPTTPFRKPVDRESAFARFGPPYRQTKLQSSNTAPDFQDISLLSQFHCRRARRMIADDHIKRAIAQRLPKRFAICTLTERRAAFEFRRAARTFFGSKMQIVKSSFGG